MNYRTSLGGVALAALAVLAVLVGVALPFDTWAALVPDGWQHLGLAVTAAVVSANGRVEALRGVLIELADRTRAIQDKATREGRELTDDEHREIVRISEEFDRVEVRLRTEERLAGIEERVGRSVGRKSDPSQPGAGSPVASRAGRSPEAESLQVRAPYVGRYAADLFGPAPQSDVDPSDFVRAVLAKRGPGLQVLNAYGSSGIGSEGGFAVPPTFAFGLWDSALEGEIVRPRAHVIPMASNSIAIGGFDTLNHSGGAISGFTGVWAKEGGTFTAQAPKMRSVWSTVKKLGIYGQLTNEVLFDSDNIWNRLGPLMSQTLGWNLDAAFINGDGVGRPQGVMFDPALITQTKESGQTAGTILGMNVLKMYARLHPACLRSAVWLVNATTLPQLMGISINAERGTDGLAVVSGPLMREVAPGSFTLMGIPVIVTEHCPTIGTKGDIILAAFSEYFVFMRREIILDSTQAASWSQDMTDFRSIVRVDGMGKWNAPMTPKNGSTLSWCVTLETR